eukprot:gene9133-18322_t
MTEHAVVQGRCKVQTKNYRWRDAKEGGDDSAESKPVLNIELEYEVRGNDGDPAVLMIHGHGMQLIGWRREELVDQFIDAGFQVIRFDNRDIGLSTRLNELGPVGLRPIQLVAQRFWNALLHKRAIAFLVMIWVAYQEAQRGANSGDAALWAAFLGYLFLAFLYICKLYLSFDHPTPSPSYEVATSHPDRLLSLTLVYTAPGPGIGPTMASLSSLLLVQYYNTLVLAAANKAASEGKTQAEIFEKTWEYKLKIAKNNKTKAFFNADETKQHLLEYTLRSSDDSGKGRQTIAILTREDNLANLKKLKLPVLDPLIPYANGKLLAESIPKARMLSLVGGAHDLPSEWCNDIATEVIALWNDDARPHQIRLTTERNPNKDSPGESANARGESGEAVGGAEGAAGEDDAVREESAVEEGGQGGQGGGDGEGEEKVEAKKKTSVKKKKGKTKKKKKSGKKSK